MDQNKCVIPLLQSNEKNQRFFSSCAPQVEQLMQCNQQNRQLDFHDLNWIFFSIRLSIYLYSNISYFSSLYTLGPHTMLFFGPEICIGLHNELQFTQNMKFQFWQKLMIYGLIRPYLSIKSRKNVLNFFSSWLKIKNRTPNFLGY